MVQNVLISSLLHRNFALGYHVRFKLPIPLTCRFPLVSKQASQETITFFPRWLGKPTHRLFLSSRLTLFKMSEGQSQSYFDHSISKSWSRVNAGVMKCSYSCKWGGGRFSQCLGACNSQLSWDPFLKRICCMHGGRPGLSIIQSKSYRQVWSSLVNTTSFAPSISSDVGSYSTSCSLLHQTVTVISFPLPCLIISIYKDGDSFWVSCSYLKHAEAPLIQAWRAFASSEGLLGYEETTCQNDDRSNEATGVIVHGLLGSGRNWRTFSKVLANNFAQVSQRHALAMLGAVIV